MLVNNGIIRIGKQVWVSPMWDYNAHMQKQSFAGAENGAPNICWLSKKSLYIITYKQYHREHLHCMLHIKSDIDTYNLSKLKSSNSLLSVHKNCFQDAWRKDFSKKKKYSLFAYSYWCLLYYEKKVVHPVTEVVSAICLTSADVWHTGKLVISPIPRGKI